MQEHRITHPILIHGILPRSGTNYLNKLILKDSSCEQPRSRIRENWYLHYSGHLMSYFEELFKMWSKPDWSGEAFSKEEFQQALGDCILDFLSSQISSSQKRLVTKTPSVEQMINIDLLFPEVKNVIIVRNPLDVAASTFNSWRVPVDVTISKWITGCEAIHSYEKKNGGSGYYLLRYEDLIADLPQYFAPCIEFLGLNPEAFDWDSIEKMPVYGSSDSGSKWEVNEKKEGFQAVGKWKNLPDSQNELLWKTYSETHAKYFGYSGFNQENELFPLPDRAARLEHGSHWEDIDRSTECPSEVIASSRKQDLKNGLKLVLKALRP
ncbi:MAG: sulfotransferase [Bacteroidetes bacterium]|nr:sulfotransferase [Bacteroidota bacterium]